MALALYLSCRSDTTGLRCGGRLCQIDDHAADIKTQLTRQESYQTQEKLVAEAAAKAESQVERWREENRLPFPEHEEGLRFELSSTLDYPPEGSAGNKRHRPDTSSSDS